MQRIKIKKNKLLLEFFNFYKQKKGFFLFFYEICKNSHGKNDVLCKKIGIPIFKMQKKVPIIKNGEQNYDKKKFR